MYLNCELITVLSEKKQKLTINPSDISFDQMTNMVGIPLLLSDDNRIGQNDNRQLRHLTGDYR